MKPIFFGGIILVNLLYTIPKPCEKYNVLFSRLSDYYFYTNLRDEFIGVSIKTIVDQIFGPQQ